MVAIKACASCGATVGPEEVAQGLAVIAQGRLLCPQCVEHLPSESRVAVNQMRALRGLATTTYRLSSPRLPGLVLFTFTTSALVLSHRRRLAHGEEVVTPPLPPAGSRPRLPTAAEAARGERRGWIVVLAVAVVVIVGMIWLFGGFEASRPVAPPATPPTTTPVVAPVTAAPVEPATPAPRYAVQITELENRLRSHPAEAAEIQRQAELLHDAIPASEVFLRNRAADLIRAAGAALPQPVPVAPKPVPVPPAQVEAPVKPAPPPVAPVPPTVIETPKPVEVVPPPMVVKPPSDPKPPDPKPPADPKPPKPKTTKPKPDFVDYLPGRKPDAPAEPIEEVRTETLDPMITWPDRPQPVVTPDAPAPTGSNAIPWPWPSGVTIWEAQLDRRGRQRRVAIEMAVPAISGAGGLALAVDPRRADRTALVATWTDGTHTSPGIDLALDASGWQTLAIPLPGPEVALDRERLRLRLEDAKELQETRPLLVGGATVVHGRAPKPEDCDPGLPLIAPAVIAELGTPASREVAFRKAFALVVKSLPERRDVSAAKILLPDIRDDSQQAFRSELRKRLELFQRQVRHNEPPRVLDGNPGDLPLDDRTGLLDPKAAWPAATMGDLDQYAVAVLGLRRADWLPDSELPGGILRLLDKLRTAQARPRRTALLPVFTIGDIQKADGAGIAGVEARWLPVAQALLVHGYPVIDLRPAMREKHADDARRTAARLMIDALHQIDWLTRQQK